MATATPSAPALLTAEEFLKRPDPGHPEELDQGRIVPMPPPGARHGLVCVEVVFLLKLYLRENDVGRVVSNDAGVVTRRGPDSVRGPDVSFYGYEKLPRDERPLGYPGVAPDLVVEVLSPEDRWSRVMSKVVEYLDAGVPTVLVLDPERRQLHWYEGDAPDRVLGESDELALGGVLEGFRAVVGRFFD